NLLDPPCPQPTPFLGVRSALTVLVALPIGVGAGCRPRMLPLRRQSALTLLIIANNIVIVVRGNDTDALGRPKMPQPLTKIRRCHGADRFRERPDRNKPRVLAGMFALTSREVVVMTMPAVVLT